jgi:hypothetical protein
LLVDKYAHQKNVKSEFEEQEFFGEVKYFFAHEYIIDSWSMLALVQWVYKLETTEYGPKKFRKMGHKEIISVSSIKRSVGFLAVSNNEYYIIDRENSKK